MSPYLKPQRLQDIVAALQMMGTYRKYKMSIDEWKNMLENDPHSAGSWADVFKEHPEFFRENDKGLFSLMWRRAFHHDDESRPPLSADHVMALMDTAITFHAKAHEEQRDKRWWIPIFAAFMGFAGAILGSYLRGVMG